MADETTPVEAPAAEYSTITTDATADAIAAEAQATMAVDAPKLAKANESKPAETNDGKESAEKQPEETETATQGKAESPRRENGRQQHNRNGEGRSYKEPGYRSRNKKFDPSKLPTTDDPDAIRQQIHFYFGDSNLPFDQHLWELTGGSENIPTDLKHVCTFGRMKRMQPYEAVVKALKESDFVNITGEEGQELISRKEAYKVNTTRSPREASTVYVKGFGDETPTSQFDIEAFFAKFGTMNAIRLRRKDDGSFKSSVFAEFSDQKQAEAFLATEPKPMWQGTELKIMSKRAYVDEKAQLINDGKIQPSRNQSHKFYEGSRGNHRGGRGGRDVNNFKGRDKNGDADDWKSRRDNDQKNGFRNNRGGGGRGRGRGRGRDNDRGGQDRNAERRAREEEEGKTEVKTEAKTEAKTEEGESQRPSKRERDGEADQAEQPALKKVDTKTEVAAEG